MSCKEANFVSSKAEAPSSDESGADGPAEELWLRSFSGESCAWRQFPHVLDAGREFTGELSAHAKPKLTVGFCQSRVPVQMFLFKEVPQKENRKIAGIIGIIRQYE